jgi:hypothetical protein
MQLPELTQFYEAIQEDSRISPSHIAVYMALFQCWHLRGFQDPVPIIRREVMQAAKISGLATYHRCIRDLHAFGYIRYQPCYNPAKPSVVWLARKKLTGESTVCPTPKQGQQPAGRLGSQAQTSAGQSC